MAFYYNNYIPKPKPDPFLLQQQAVEWANRVREMNAVVTDTESCGGRKEDEIISIGICRVVDGHPLFYSLVKPSPIAKFNYFATKVHGIKERDLHNSPSIKEIWHKIHPHLEQNIVLAYNESADRRMIVQTANNHNITIPNISWECVMKKYKDYNLGKATTLTQACAHLNVKAGGHNALEDAIATARLIYRMAKEYEKPKTPRV